jgi:excisionase family DNA binding protein
MKKDDARTIEEVARVLGLKERTARRYIASGRIRGVRDGDSLSVRVEDLIAYNDSLPEPEVGDTYPPGRVPRPLNDDDPFVLFVEAVHSGCDECASEPNRRSANN